MQVVNGSQLDVEQISDLPVTVGIVPDAVKLQICEPESGLGCFLCVLFALRELDAVRCSLNTGVTDLAGIRDRIEEIRRHGRLAAGELDRHLTPWLDLERVVH